MAKGMGDCANQKCSFSMSNFSHTGLEIPFQIITTHLTIPISRRTFAEARLAFLRTEAKGENEKGDINGRIARSAL